MPVVINTGEIIDDDWQSLADKAPIPEATRVIVSLGRLRADWDLLRERYVFKGDIRAQGEVLRDQLSFMQRCGINQFRLADDEDVVQALSVFTDISQNYQPALKH
jgi:hypothetical protein